MKFYALVDVCFINALIDQSPFLWKDQLIMGLIHVSLSLFLQLISHK